MSEEKQRIPLGSRLGLSGELTQPIQRPAQLPALVPLPPREGREKMVTASSYMGTLTFDGKLVTIVRTKLLSRLTVGKGEKRIPVSKITSVQWKPAGLTVKGVISFSIGGGNEKQSRFGYQTSTAVRDENSVVFARRHQAQFEIIREAIENSLG